MAARLIKLCRYYRNFLIKDNSYSVARHVPQNWNNYVDQLAEYVISDVAVESKSEIEKLFKNPCDQSEKSLNEKLSLFESMGV